MAQVTLSKEARRDLVSIPRPIRRTAVLAQGVQSAIQFKDRAVPVFGRDDFLIAH